MCGSRRDLNVIQEEMGQRWSSTQIRDQRAEGLIVNVVAFGWVRGEESKRQGRIKEREREWSGYTSRKHLTYQRDQDESEGREMSAMHR
jgi:hypothetical protein